MRAAGSKAPRSGAAARVLAAALAAALLVSLGVFHIWSRTRVLASGYELGELTRAHDRLLSDNGRLRIEVETLRSPARLEPYARTKLGMAPPAPGAVLAAGPRLASATSGRAGVDGVGHPPVPAEPPLGRAAAAGHAANPGAQQVALRGPLRAGRAPVERN